MIKAKKELGQNFMKDPEIIKSMVSALDLKNDEVLEIGPGLGAFTKEIVKNLGDKGSLQAIEFDFRFISTLRNQFSKFPNVKIDYANFLDYYQNFKPMTSDFKIFGSLPYYITSPIFHVIAKSPFLPSSCVFMVQYEVARKVCEVAPDSSYLSVFMQTFFDITFLTKVPRDRFDPVPGVDGGIVKFVRKSIIEISHREILSYEKFLHHAYSNPRKMLNKVFDAEFLSTVNIDPTLRPQNITTEEWVRIFKMRKPQ